MRKLIVGLLAVLLVLIVALQLVPVSRTNPPVRREPAWNSPQTRALADRACFDCHSNQTRWPWYAYVAPMSWLVAHDVEEGREKLNFSEWEAGEDNEASEEVLEGTMPPQTYLLMHPEARLTPAEIQALVAGLNATLGDGERRRRSR